MQTTKEQEQIIHWSMLHEPGDAVAREVFNQRGTQALADFESGVAHELWPSLVGVEFAQAVADMLERIELRWSTAAVTRVVERGIRWGFRPVFAQDAPDLFEHLADLAPHDPYLLWVAGDISNLQGAVSVVGTRSPSESGRENARSLVRQLHLPVISGGAVGIDSEAHRAALELGLPTAAVMAGGLDRAYPQSNWELFHNIVQSGGAMISEMAAGQAPTRWRFLQRNRLIAALGQATYVVEAGYRSGSVNTANHAKLLGRDVFALIAPVNSGAAKGCNSMVASGLATPLPVSGAKYLNPRVRQRVADAQRNGAKTVLEVARDSGVPVRQVRGIIH